MDEKQKWENLTISNDFMFAKVMRNRDICRKILEKILKIEIKRMVLCQEKVQIKMRSSTGYAAGREFTFSYNFSNSSGDR